jgi:hypothetical protein
LNRAGRLAEDRAPAGRRTGGWRMAERRPWRRAFFAGLLLAVLGAACTADPPAPAGAAATTAATVPPPTTVAPTTTTAPPPPTLPRGGRKIFPRFRVVGFYGMPGLDALGAGPPDLVAERLLRQARAYVTPGHPILPMFELIATIAHPVPAGGLYRSRQDAAVVDRYLQAARRHRGVLVLDVQPGRADFLDEVRHWEPLLRQPDVGLALDPEFSMGAGGIPGKHLGHTDADTINRVSAYVAEIVRRDRLPEKLFLVHQFAERMILDKTRVKLRPGLAMVWNADGFGSRDAKLDDYRSYTRDGRFHPGLKLFYRLDIDLMSPREVLRLRPVPRLIDYQ